MWRHINAGWLLLLLGCTVGPDYVRPTITVPEVFKEGKGWKVAEPSAPVVDDHWWEMFGDPQLNALERKLITMNQTIASAEAQYRQSVALYDGATAAFYPTLGVQTSTLRIRNAMSSSDSSATSTQYKLALTASWESGLWGQLRRAAEASRANVAASAAELASARLSAQAQLATAYLQWRVAVVQKTLLEQSVVAYQRQLDTIQYRCAAGVVARSDVLNIESQLKSAQVQLADKVLQGDQLQHAIAILIGVPPADLALIQPTSLPFAPEVPLLLPSSLLERRPDIAAAERFVAAANAQIGVAQAAYFPDLSLSANGGYVGGTFIDWLMAAGRFWSLGPQLALTLFDGGAQRAQVAQTVANYDQTVAAYRQTVLNAFQDVEDCLATLRTFDDEWRKRHRIWQAAVEIEAMTENQFRVGTVAYLNVLQAQTSRQASERAYYDTLSLRLAARVSLIRALGGGW